MEEKNKKRQIAKISVFITSIFVIFMSVTYAFITQTLTGTKEVVVSAGVLDLVLEEENAITISDALPMHDAVGMIQEDVFMFRLVNKTSNPTNYILKLSKINSSNELSSNDVKYYLTKEGVGEPALLSTLPLDGTVDSGTIAGNDTIDYTLRLWINSGVTSNEVIEGKTLSYRIDVEASQEIAKSPLSVELKLFDDINLDYYYSCFTYDDGVDTFLVGECARNYVWYSGKLWRVVLKNNETGAVKMVTDNSITTISYNASDNTAFENSYMDQWLNQEFLPTLHDYENYLVVDSVWDATLTSSDTPTRPSYTTSLTRTVGSLNSYEYYTTYNNIPEEWGGAYPASFSYLNNNTWFWLMTPYDTYKTNFVRADGDLSGNNVVYGYGIRPSVNLKAGVQIKSGTGTEDNPYILEGDLQEPAKGTTLLNTRYSGEYITFNNELYRIVDKENGLTKITAVNKPTELKNNAFGNYYVSFEMSTIKTDLENYYQNLKTTNQDSYNMIEPSTTWYLGSVGSSTTYHYKASICANVDSNISMNACVNKTTLTKASIGLPRLGEMFTSHISRTTSGIRYTNTSFWTLTPANTSFLNYIFYDGSLQVTESIDNYGARPSMYLKSNVVIASDNTGNGTYEHPYKIELGA